MVRTRYTISKYALNDLVKPIRDYVKDLAVGACYRNIVESIPDIEIYVDRLWQLTGGDIDEFIRLLNRTFFHELLHYLGVRDEKKIRFLEAEIDDYI